MDKTDTSKKHKEEVVQDIAFAIITMSSTRTLEEDTAGAAIRQLAESQGHRVVEHVVIKDDKQLIQVTLQKMLDHAAIQVIVMNGGTGVAKKDVTVEAVEPLFDKRITSFNPLFAKLSYESVGSVALLSRATAGIAKGKAIFCTPGSPRACALAMEKLILPEAGHILKHLGE